MRNVLIALLALFLISGCSGITEQEAEDSATEFINKNVKFFTSEGTEKENVTTYVMDILDVHKEGGVWSVLVNVSAQKGSENKKKAILVKTDNKGNVVEFDGNKI